MNSAYDEEKRRYLNWLVGKEVVLATSESEFERLSNEVLDRVLLKCATVTPFKNDDFVEAECLTPSGYDKIKVVLSDQSQRYMQSVSQYLSDSSERIKKYDFNLRLKFYLISVPSMFYLYLFASLFAWVIYKGYRYVRYG